MLRRLTGPVAMLPLLLLGAGVAGMVGLFLAGMSVGFDFTDEGCYYLSFAHPEAVPDSYTAYYIFGGKVFALLGRSVTGMRLATLCAMLGSTMVFLWGTGRFASHFAPELQPDSEHRRLTGAVALGASLLGFGISPAALSYNFQNACCLLSGAGLLLYACTQSREGSWMERRTLAALTGFGLLVGLDLFIKFSTSVLLAGAGGLLFFVVSRKSLRQKAGLAGVLAGCAVAIVLVHFGFFQNFSRWWEGTRGTLNAIVRGGYAGREIGRYGGEIGAVMKSAIQDLIPVWLVVLPASLLMAILRLQPRWQRGVAALAGGWTLFHLVWLFDLLRAQGGSRLSFLFGGFALIGFAALVSRLAVKDRGQGPTPGRWRAFAGIVFCASLPCIGAFGTSNNILSNCFYQLAPWFVLAAWLLAEIDRIWQSAWPSRLALLGLGILIGGQFYEQYWQQPYRVAGTRQEQTETTPLGFPPATLRLNPATHDFVTTSRRILAEHGFKAGDDLIVLFDLPGFVFAMGGVSPQVPWYFHGDHDSFANDSMNLRSIELARRQQAFIVRNGFFEDSTALLREAGLNFPDNYQLITPAMASPFTQQPFEIWMPRNRTR